MTRDEAMRAVVEAARAAIPRGAYSLVWSALDRLDAIPEEPVKSAIDPCAICGHPRGHHSAMHAFAEPEAPAPEQKTVRARVCVVTDEDGVWVANGDRHMEDARIQREAMNLFTSGSHLRVTWLEGPVGIPQPQTIEGEVVG